MQYTPKVSVVMSAYNETTSQLKESIDSILNQTFEDFEFIIVNDNPSSNKLKNILQQYKSKDDRIIIIENEKNIGLSKSLNKAINKSVATYIMRMDADDISVDNRMEYQYEFMEKHPTITMVAGDKENIDENSKKIPGGRIIHVDDKHLEKMLKYGNPIVHPSVMIRKSVFNILHGYRDIRGGEDYDLWLRMLTNGNKISVLYEPPILLYRIRNNSITRSDFFWSYFSGQYARKLYRERIKYGRDSYSVESMKMYMKRLRDNKRKCKTVNAIYKEIEGSANTGKRLRMLSEIIKNPFVMDVVGNFVLYKVFSL